MRMPPLIVYDAVRHPLRARMSRTFARPLPAEPMGDLQLFVMTFCAGFLAFYGFMS